MILRLSLCFYTFFGMKVTTISGNEVDIMVPEKGISVGEFLAKLVDVGFLQENQSRNTYTILLDDAPLNVWEDASRRLVKAHEKATVVSINWNLENDRLFAASIPDIRAALDAGADVNCFDSNGNTPLVYYLQRQNYWENEQSLGQTLQLLIERGADVNKANAYGQIPLCVNMNDRYWPNITRLLIENRADVNEEVLFRAIASNSSQKVQILLRARANVHATNNDGYTPLSFAEFCFAQNLDQRRPLYNYCLREGLKIIHLLQQHGE